MVASVSIAGVAFALVAAAEAIHARRSLRLERLAFGPRGARPWTRFVGIVRASLLAVFAWACAMLAGQVEASPEPTGLRPREDAHRVVLVLDVSPSMHVRDAGSDETQTRDERARELAWQLVGRLDTRSHDVTLVAFYTGDAKPVLVRTRDLGVVVNLLTSMPLEKAFADGQTEMLSGLRAAFELARDWPEKSATVVVLSDGDSVPPTGMPAPPPAIRKVWLCGVGSAAGRPMKGRQSFQDSTYLRQIARRLQEANGEFVNVTGHGLPWSVSASLAQGVGEQPLDQSELARMLLLASALVLVLIPFALRGWGGSHP